VVTAENFTRQYTFIKENNCPMKKTSLSIFIIIIFSLFMAPFVAAQSPTNNIETLIIDLWPDYDEPSVLVLLTGTLSSNTSLPATITIPLSEGAEINAIARITNDNQMIDDLEYTTGSNTITFTTPDPRFRIEYYAPYEKIGINHAFSFDWLANISVVNALAAVQQPSTVTNMNVTPTTANVVADNTDGFTYYTFPPQPIPAGELFTITFDYDMATPQLSVDNRPVANASATVNNSTTTEFSSSDSLSLDNINWVLVVGILGLFVAAILLTWHVATRANRPANKKRKTRSTRNNTAAKTSGQVRFCHQCGNKLNISDKFCRDCGTAVK
jgi:hypothetical protein